MRDPYEVLGIARGASFEEIPPRIAAHPNRVIPISAARMSK